MMSQSILEKEVSKDSGHTETVGASIPSFTATSPGGRGFRPKTAAE
jgi:hypothetical protein